MGPAMNDRKPVPGYPERHLPPIRMESEQTPQSVPPGTVRIGGPGWKVNLPWAVVLAVGSAIGARLLPTPTNTDVAIEKAELAAERERMLAERFRDEMRGSVRAVNDRLDRLETRISLLEAAKKGP